MTNLDLDQPFSPPPSRRKKQKPRRVELLETGAGLTSGDRDKTYGPPLDNLTSVAGLWTAYLIAKYRGKTLDEIQFHLSAEDVAHLNTLQKIGRTFRASLAGTAPHLDNYTDAAVYSAIAGEVAEQDAQAK